MFNYSSEPMQEVSDVSNPGWASLTVILICLLVWGCFLPATLSHNSWVYSWDSAAYIETAQSLLAGRGLKHRVILGLGRELWEPISWWPPGYSVLIALAQIAGLPVVKGCVGVSVIAAVISVILMAWICLRLFYWAVALPLTLTAIIMPSFLQISTQCLSDSSYFAFALASIACLVEWTIRSRAGLVWVFWAGLFAGASWGTRYSGSALLAATGMFLFLHIIWFRFDHVIRVVIVWLFGVAVCSLPLVIRNLMIFGQINPYSMAPSDLSLWVNVRQASSVIVEDMTASTLDVNWIVDKDRLLIYALILIATVGFWGWRTSWPRIHGMLGRHRVQIFLLAYLIIYMAIVILARTKFRWGEEINPRYLVQIYWILWICLASWLATALRSTRISSNIGRGALVVVLGAIGLLHLNHHLQEVSRPAVRPDAAESRVGGPAVTYLAREVGKDQIVLSIRADLLRIHSNVNARKIPPIAQYDFLEAITRDDINRLGQEGFLWGLVIEDLEGAKRGDYDSLIKNLVERPEQYPELERVRITSPALIFRYNRQTPVYRG